MFERAICRVSVTLTTSIAFKRVTAKLMMLLGICGVKFWQYKTETDPFKLYSRLQISMTDYFSLHWLNVFYIF